MRVLPRCANAHNCLGIDLKSGFRIDYKKLTFAQHDFDSAYGAYTVSEYMNMDRLLNKPYVNGIILEGKTYL